MYSDNSSYTLSNQKTHILSLKHYKDSDKKEELSEDDGMLSVTGSQLKREIIFMARDSSHESSSECYIPARFGKNGSFSTIVYSDNSSYTLSNKLIPLNKYILL